MLSDTPHEAPQTQMRLSGWIPQAVTSHKQNMSQSVKHERKKMAEVIEIGSRCCLSSLCERVTPFHFPIIQRAGAPLEAAGWGELVSLPRYDSLVVPTEQRLG